MKKLLPCFLMAGALAATATVLSAQLSIPEVQFDSNADLLKFPADVHMGEAAGVASNSRGDIFLYTRTGNPSIVIGTSRAVSHGGSRLFQFDRTGKFVREIGQGAYGMLQAQQVRVDPQDNVWIVDQMSTQVIKFDPNGRVQMVLSRKPEAMRVPALPLVPLPTGIPIVQALPAAAAPAAGRGAEPAAGRGAEPAAGRGAAPAAPAPGSGPPARPPAGAAAAAPPPRPSPAGAAGCGRRGGTSANVSGGVASGSAGTRIASGLRLSTI